jgi:hypothetical protein
MCRVSARPRWRQLSPPSSERYTPSPCEALPRTLVSPMPTYSTFGSLSAIASARRRQCRSTRPKPCARRGRRRGFSTRRRRSGRSRSDSVGWPATAVTRPPRCGPMSRARNALLWLELVTARFAGPFILAAGAPGSPSDSFVSAQQARVFRNLTGKCAPISHH